MAVFFPPELLNVSKNKENEIPLRNQFEQSVTEQIFESSNGDFYQGNMVAGLKCGWGVYTWSDGSIYEGTFFVDKRHGYGYFRNKHYSFVGTYFLDQRCGFGLMKYQNGQIFQGFFEDDGQQGAGVYLNQTVADNEIIQNVSIDSGYWRKNRIARLCIELDMVKFYPALDATIHAWYTGYTLASSPIDELRPFCASFLIDTDAAITHKRSHCFLNSIEAMESQLEHLINGRPLHIWEQLSCRFDEESVSEAFTYFIETSPYWISLDILQLQWKRKNNASSSSPQMTQYRNKTPANLGHLSSDSSLVSFIHNYSSCCGFFANRTEAHAAIKIWNSAEKLPPAVKPGSYIEVATKFLDACQKEDIETVRSLLIPSLSISRKDDTASIAGVVDVNVMDQRGRCALLIAVLLRNKALTNLLLDFGANPNQQTSEGYTPLSASILLYLRQKGRRSGMGSTKVKTNSAHLVNCPNVRDCYYNSEPDDEDNKIRLEPAIKSWWHRAELVWRLKTEISEQREIEKAEEKEEEKEEEEEGDEPHSSSSDHSLTSGRVFTYAFSAKNEKRSTSKGDTLNKLEKFKPKALNAAKGRKQWQTVLVSRFEGVFVNNFNLESVTAANPSTASKNELKEMDTFYHRKAVGTTRLPPLITKYLSKSRYIELVSRKSMLKDQFPIQQEIMVREKYQLCKDEEMQSNENHREDNLELSHLFPLEKNTSQLLRNSRSTQIMEMIKLLLRRNACPNAVEGRPIPTLLMPFIIQAKDDYRPIDVQNLIRLLLSHGANPNLCMPERTTPYEELLDETGFDYRTSTSGLSCLHYAVLLPEDTGIEITKMLLESFANPNIRAKPDDSFLDAKSQMFKQNFENEKGSNIEEEVQKLLQEEFKCHGGRTALHLVCARDYDYENAGKIVKLLMEYGANPNLLCNGHSALSLAIGSGNDFAVEHLLANADTRVSQQLTHGLGSALCVAAEPNFEFRRSLDQRIKLIKRLIEVSQTEHGLLGTRVIIPYIFCEGNVIDHVYYQFGLDLRISKTPYYLMTLTERQKSTDRAQVLSLLVDRMRAEAYQSEWGERLLGTDSDDSDLSICPKPSFVFCYECCRSVGVKLEPCGRCKLVYYCSTACKLLGWKARHKQQCLRIKRRIESRKSTLKQKNVKAVLPKRQGHQWRPHDPDWQFDATKDEIKDAGWRDDQHPGNNYSFRWGRYTRMDKKENVWANSFPPNGNYSLL